MDSSIITISVKFNIEFYDVDSMRIVWHGNYIKYFEKARCALLNSIGYNYLDMVDTGYAFPVTDVRVKYIKPLYFGDAACIKATLVEYENRIKIKYEIYNDTTGILTTKGESTQMAVKMSDRETLFICPEVFIKRVESLIVEKQECEANKQTVLQEKAGV